MACGWEWGVKRRLRQRGQHKQKYRGMEAAGDGERRSPFISPVQTRAHTGSHGVSGEESEELASPDHKDTCVAG